MPQSPKGKIQPSQKDVPPVVQSVDKPVSELPENKTVNPFYYYGTENEQKNHPKNSKSSPRSPSPSKQPSEKSRSRSRSRQKKRQYPKPTHKNRSSDSSNRNYEKHEKKYERHNDYRSRNDPIPKEEAFRKTKMCPQYEKGLCRKGTSCNYAHGQSELRGLPDFRKTRLCIAFKEGKCGKLSSQCKYAHGEAELRKLPKQSKDREKEKKRSRSPHEGYYAKNQQEYYSQQSYYPPPQFQPPMNNSYMMGSNMGNGMGMRMPAPNMNYGGEYAPPSNNVPNYGMNNYMGSSSGSNPYYNQYEYYGPYNPNYGNNNYGMHPPPKPPQM